MADKEQSGELGGDQVKDQVKEQVKVGPLKKSELAEADRIMRLSFETFMGIPQGAFMPGRDLIFNRFRSRNVQALAAREGGRLIGSNFWTTWGSFAFFGPITVLPEYWNKGVAQKLLQATVEKLDAARLRRTALFTFPHSTKHVGLYNKFGYWPQQLTALMHHTPATEASERVSSARTVYLSELPRAAREEAITACRRVANGIDKGLDLSEEIRALVQQKIGEVLLVYTRNTLDGFAIACTGPRSEGGTTICYLKFAAARGGAGAGERFENLLEACDQFARSKDVMIEAGVNFAHEDAYRRMRARGYRAYAQGVAMQRPNVPGFNRPDAYVINDWR